METPRPKISGIKEIATALKISLGTVDRALHDRPGVSAKTRTRVLAMAEKLNYRPNVAAQNLKLNRHLRIGVYLPQQIASFFDPLRAGIRAAAASVHGVNIELEFHQFPRSGEGDMESLRDDMKRHYDGVLITPGPGRMEPLLLNLAQHGTAVVCVASDAPRSERLSSVAVDAKVSGGIAAELLAISLPKGGTVAVITGSLEVQDHAEKLRGFAATLATIAPHLTLSPAIESHDNPKEAYRAALKLLSRKPRPIGLYISTANSIPVLRALAELNLFAQVKVVTTDLFAELVPFIESGRVLASLYQRPFEQGKSALEGMIRYLVSGVKPEAITLLAPHIVLRTNLPVFLDRLDQIESAKNTDI